MNSTQSTNSTGYAAPTKVSPDRPLIIERNTLYPTEIWWALACLIALVSFCQLLSTIIRRSSLASRLRSNATLASDPEKAGSATVAPAVTSMNRVPVSLVNLFRVVAFRHTLSIHLGRFGNYTLNVAEFGLTCIYIVILFTWAFIGTTTLSGIKLSSSYWANRTGIIAASQLPLIVALGTKHNVISWITGVGYDKLNYLHRAAARVMFVVAWVHAGMKIKLGVTKYLGFPWLQWGIAGTAALSLLMFVSLKPVRKNAYELFFYVHFFTVLIFLLGIFFHAKHREYHIWVWPAFIFWALDRFLRVVRTAINNFTSAGGPSLQATPELVSPHCVRLRVRRPAHGGVRWSPGQTAFLILPGVSSFPLEAHPFTISSAPTVVDNSKEMVFLINVHEGFTRRLANAAEQRKSVTVLVDGAYGESPDLRADDTVILIAGGTGVSFTLALFQDLVNQVKEGKSLCRKVVFIWACRDQTHISWIAAALAKAIEASPKDLAVDIRIHVTTAQDSAATLNQPSLEEDDSVHSPTKEDLSPTGSESNLVRNPDVRVLYGRPILENVLHEEVGVAPRGSRFSVTVCGSTSIAQATQKALQFGPALVLNGGPSVILHVESYGYA